MLKTRDPVFDIMKGFAILFVIMSHSNVPFSPHVFASLRSPLFFIVSGYFAKEWFFADFMKNGAKRLFLPLMFTSLSMLPIVFAWDLLFDTNVFQLALCSLALGTSSWIGLDPNISQLSTGPLWFVWTSILVRIYWSFLQKWGGIGCSVL